jgi:hypothetical protein
MEQNFGVSDLPGDIAAGLLMNGRVIVFNRAAVECLDIVGYHKLYSVY